MRVISSALCEKYADEVVREYPLVCGIVSADLEDGLPIYTVKIAGEASSADQDNRYSHEALVVREENLVILATFNKKWKKEVVRVGEQIDPITEQRSPHNHVEGQAAVSRGIRTLLRRSGMDGLLQADSTVSSR